MLIYRSSSDLIDVERSMLTAAADVAASTAVYGSDQTSRVGSGRVGSDKGDPTRLMRF